MNEHRHIDVSGQAIIQRKIEAYVASVKLTVSTRKRQNVLAESLKLREQILDALKAAGIAENEIEEAGGSINHRSWSARKEVVHELRIRHKEMPMMARAMQAVERVFAGIQDPWFSGIKRDFTFQIPEPQFALDDDATEIGLASAISIVKFKAAVLARELGVDLDGVVSVNEIREVPASKPERFPDVSNDDDGSLLMEMEEDYTEYKPVAQRKGFRRVMFRARFAIK